MFLFPLWAAQKLKVSRICCSHVWRRCDIFSNQQEHHEVARSPFYFMCRFWATWKNLMLMHVTCMRQFIDVAMTMSEWIHIHLRVAAVVFGSTAVWSVTREDDETQEWKDRQTETWLVFGETRLRDANWNEMETRRGKLRCRNTRTSSVFVFLNTAVRSCCYQIWVTTVNSDE